MSEAEEPLFDDTDFDAFLAESVERDSVQSVEEMIRQLVSDQVDDALATAGYRSLEEDPQRYMAERDAILRGLRDEVHAKNSAVTEDPLLSKTLENWANLRVLELNNYEKAIIDFMVTVGAYVEKSARLASPTEARATLEWAVHNKREMYATVLIREIMPDDNPVLMAMVEYLPGGPVHKDDEVLIPYFIQAMEGLADADKLNAQIAEAHRAAYALIGMDIDAIGRAEDFGRDSLRVAEFVSKGVQWSQYSLARREEKLYEFAREYCSFLSPQAVSDLVHLVNRTFPAR